MAPYFAAAESGSLLEALGIDWQMLIFQIIGFAILVFLMAKFVYPPLIKTIDDRQEKIEAGNKAAQEAEQSANNAKEEVAKMLKQAREEARDIVATAKEEATAVVEASDSKAKDQAERIVKSAHEQIDKDIVAAKKALHNETLELVALATEKVVGKAVSKDIDKKVISSAVKEAN